MLAGDLLLDMLLQRRRYCYLLRQNYFMTASALQRMIYRHRNQFFLRITLQYSASLVNHDAINLLIQHLPACYCDETGNIRSH